MWKLGLSCSRFLLSQTLVKPKARTFLSESFKLEQAWNERLSSPIIKKINVNNMFLELDHQFQHYANASALDIDLFVNAVNDDSNFDEIEDVVHKLRLSPEAVNILPSTHHALIRLYLQFNKTDDLLRVLDDRLNYGIFSDDYCSLLLMDTFIKNNNFRDAAKIGILSMLQEDVSNPLVNYMSLFSCHKYLENPVQWNEVKEDVEEGDDDDEEVKVRVRYIRNPYFDDHFDLIDPTHLIGKTFQLIGSQIDDPLGVTHQLLGFVLHDKLDRAKQCVQKVLSSQDKSNVIVKDGLTLALNILDDKSKNVEKDENKLSKISELKSLLETSFLDKNLMAEKGILQIIEEHLKDLVQKNESIETEKQLQYYKKWEENRVQLLNEQLIKVHKEKQLAEIQRQKQLLQEKEEELYFFDNEDKLDLIIEEKEKIKEKQREHERMKMEEKMKGQAKKEEKKKSKFPPEPDLKDFIDENIPMKLINTKI